MVVSIGAQVFQHEVMGAVGVTIILVAIATLAYRRGTVSADAADSVRRNHIRSLSSVMLGLLSLLLGFSFSMAMKRYTVRRDLVVKEANAIGTAWLRAGLLSNSQRSAVRELLQRFTDVRLRIYAAADDSALVAEGLRECAEIESELWQHAEVSVRETPNVITATFITTLNQLIDTDAERIAAARSQMPAGVWIVLIVVAALGSWTSAYAAGCDGIRSPFTRLFLPLRISLVILLVFDLTHERRGIIGISQQPLIDLHGLFRTKSP